MFKSAEEREAERREQEAARAREDAARQERARLAEDEGQTFFEVQLEVGTHSGRAGFGNIDGRRRTSSSAATLGAIERLGWTWSTPATSS